jgi:hypothetical protein
MYRLEKVLQLFVVTREKHSINPIINPNRHVWSLTHDNIYTAEEKNLCSVAVGWHEKK